MKFLSLSILATVALLSAGTLSAQTYDTTRPGTTTVVDRDTNNVTRERDNDRDWGWIGLLGLAGLFGLMPKKYCRDDRDRNDNGNRPSNTSNR